MKDHAKAIYKLELETGSYVFNISFPDGFMEKEVAKTPYHHIHAKYEVALVYGKDGGEPRFFQVNPPLCKHAIFFEKYTQPLYLTGMWLSVKKRRAGDNKQPTKQSSLLDVYLKLQNSVIVPDTFHGLERIFAVCRELQEQKEGYLEIAQAEMLMLLLELARCLSAQQDEKRPQATDLDESRLDPIDVFFMQNYSRPDCKREDLAKLLCISERQLSRILARNYAMSFRDRLLQIRMEKAESFRRSEHLTAEQLSERVGYSSASAFRAAYKNYFGHSFRER